MEVKVQTIGQSIIKSSTRTVLTSILFGLGVELDHAFGSKWFIDHLVRRGFSVTSDKVKLYRQSVLSSNSHLIDLSNFSNCSFAQWSVGNVDHNSNLGWKKVFHGMGVIVSVTPKNTDIRSQAMKRLQKKQLVDDIVKSKGIL